MTAYNIIVPPVTLYLTADDLAALDLPDQYLGTAKKVTDDIYAFEVVPFKSAKAIFEQQQDHFHRLNREFIELKKQN